MSGVVICHSYENRLRGGLPAWKFAWFRIVRICPLYLLGCTIGAITLLASGAVGASHLAFYAALALVLLPNPGGVAYPLDDPAWSLSFELAANFFYGWFCRRLNLRVLLSIVAASAVFLVPILYANPHHNLNLGFSVRTIPAGLFRVGLSFFLGVVLYRQYCKAPSIMSGWQANAIGWSDDGGGYRTADGRPRGLVATMV